MPLNRSSSGLRRPVELERALHSSPAMDLAASGPGFITPGKATKKPVIRFPIAALGLEPRLIKSVCHISCTGTKPISYR